MVMPLNIDGVVVVGGRLALASAAELDALESRLWIGFPSGYREYMERLGEGILGGTLVQIFPPWRIEKEREWTRQLHKYWFWDETNELLPKERAVECVPLGNTLDGDQLIFHPCRPDRMFALPRGGTRVFDLGSDLLEAIEFLCSSGQLSSEPFSERDFEPMDSRIPEIEEEWAGTEADKVIDPDGESIDDIVELGKRWVERHSAREWSQTHLDALEEYFGKGATTEIIFDGIVLTEDVLSANNYVLKYSVTDAQFKSKLGVFQINRSEDGTGYSIEEVYHCKKYTRPRSQRTRPRRSRYPIKGEEPKEHVTASLEALEICEGGL